MLTRLSVAAFGFHGDHFAIGGRDGHRAGGNGAVGIAEEIKAEGRQEPQRRGEPGAGQPADKKPGAGQSGRVIDAVEDDHEATIFT